MCLITPEDALALGFETFLGAGVPEIYLRVRHFPFDLGVVGTPEDENELDYVSPVFRFIVVVHHDVTGLTVAQSRQQVLVTRVFITYFVHFHFRVDFKRYKPTFTKNLLVTLLHLYLLVLFQRLLVTLNSSVHFNLL